MQTMQYSAPASQWDSEMDFISNSNGIKHLEGVRIHTNCFCLQTLVYGAFGIIAFYLPPCG